MNNPLPDAKSASRDTFDCRKVIDALPKGFGDDAFAIVHHQHRDRANFYSYYQDHEQFNEDGNNHRVHMRLVYVLLSCPNGELPKGKTFQSLARESVEFIPFI